MQFLSLYATINRFVVKKSTKYFDCSKLQKIMGNNLISNKINTNKRLYNYNLRVNKCIGK